MEEIKESLESLLEGFLDSSECKTDLFDVVLYVRSKGRAQTCGLCSLKTFEKFKEKHEIKAHVVFNAHCDKSIINQLMEQLTNEEIQQIKKSDF